MSKTTGSVSVTLRVPVDLVAALDARAAATDRSRSYVIVRALKAYIDGTGAAAIDAALERGAQRTSEDLEAQMDRIFSEKSERDR